MDIYISNTYINVYVSIDLLQSPADPRTFENSSFASAVSFLLQNILVLVREAP